MDQVKTILAGAKKNAFWIVSALTVLLGIVGYYLSRSAMDKVFTDQSTKIDGQYSALNQIVADVAKHPNSKSHEEIGKIIKGLEDDVQKAWELQYNRQAEFLKWPDGKVLSERVVNKLQKYRPIELTLEYPLEPGKDPLVRTDLNQYKVYFDKQFPALAAIIGCRWVGIPPVGGAMGGPGMGGYSGMPGGMGMGNGAEGSGGDMSGGYAMGMGGPGMTRGPDGKTIAPDLVVWPKPVQDAVIADVQTWRTELPTTHDVLYTQENIWILEGLLKIISTVNQKVGATANFQCTIKRIEFLRIGRTAVGRVGTIDMPGRAGGGGMGSGMGSGMEGSSEGGAIEGDAMGSSAGMMGSSGMGGDMGGMGMGGSGEEGSGMGGMTPMTIDPANGRYVDAAYQALTGEDLRSKMKSESPGDAYFAVAKRVPVRMRFIVDQRRLQSVLAECGNADLMLEIRQIRIGDTTPAPASGMGGMGSRGLSGDGAGGMGGYGGDMAMGGMPGGMGGMGMGGMGGMGMGGMGSGGAGGTGTAPIITSPIKSWDVPLEIYGVVYLFNPPDRAKLGLDKVTAETEVTDKVDVSADQVKPAEGTLVPETPTPAAQPAEGQPGAAGAGAPGQVAPGGNANGAGQQPQPNGVGNGNGQPVQPSGAQPNGAQPNGVGNGNGQPVQPNGNGNGVGNGAAGVPAGVPNAAGVAPPARTN